MQLYYYEGSDRRGPISPDRLRSLAAAGKITRGTIVEIGGRKIPAEKVKGLAFPAAPPIVPTPAPESPEPKSELVVGLYGGGSYQKRAPSPAPSSAPEPSDPSVIALRLAQDLEKSSALLKQAAVVFYVAAALSLIGGFVGSGMTESFAPLVSGFVGLSGFWSVAQIPAFLRKLGAFAVAAYKAENLR